MLTSIETNLIKDTIHFLDKKTITIIVLLIVFCIILPKLMPSICKIARFFYMIYIRNKREKQKIKKEIEEFRYKKEKEIRDEVQRREDKIIEIQDATNRILNRVLDRQDTIDDKLDRILENVSSF